MSTEVATLIATLQKRALAAPHTVVVQKIDLLLLLDTITEMEEAGAR